MGWHYVLLAVLGAEVRGVAASIDYDVYVLSFVSAVTMTSGNVGYVLCPVSINVMEDGSSNLSSAFLTR